MVILKALIIFFFVQLISACDAKVTLSPLEEDAIILAFGDSLTYGTGSPREQSYPEVLAQLIRPTLSQSKVINAGIPGEISQEGLNRLPSLLEKHQPDLIIICHGGNDILRKISSTTTQNNIQQMIDLANHHNTQIVLIGVPEFGVFLNASPIYQQLANDNKLVIENDILSDILSNTSLKSDQVHPNAKGYRLIAESIVSLLDRAGAITLP